MRQSASWSITNGCRCWCATSERFLIPAHPSNPNRGMHTVRPGRGTNDNATRDIFGWVVNFRFWHCCRSRRKCPISAMVEEKARSLLPRPHFSNLSYYITEYGARGMTIDAFVAVLLDMLETPEKVKSIITTLCCFLSSVLLIECSLFPYIPTAHLSHWN